MQAALQRVKAFLFGKTRKARRGSAGEQRMTLQEFMAAKSRSRSRSRSRSSTRSRPGSRQSSSNAAPIAAATSNTMARSMRGDYLPYPSKSLIRAMDQEDVQHYLNNMSPANIARFRKDAGINH